MRLLYLTVLFVVGLAGGAVEAQSTPVPSEASVITQAFVRSQALKQGDIDSLKKAEAEYTPAGLSVFIKKMDGFIDGNGAPTLPRSLCPQAAPSLSAGTMPS